MLTKPSPTAWLLAAASAGLLLACTDPELDVDTDPDLGTAESALISPQVVGLSSSGVYALRTVDLDLATDTTVATSIGSCPYYNNNGFQKLNAGYCLRTGSGPGGGTTFYGWELVTFKLDNGGAVDSVDLKLTHFRSGSSANPAPQTIVYAAWDERTFDRVATITASTTRTTTSVRLVPPTRPAPRLWVVIGKSTASAPEPAGAALHWAEVSLQSNVMTAPTNLTARAVSPSAIDLTWVDTTTGERDFEISMLENGTWRSLGADPGGANQTSERITELRGGTTYSFRVRARGVATSSPWSNIATATTPAAPPGRFAIVNDSQVDLIGFAIDNHAATPTQVTGNQAVFDLAAGVHDVAVALGFGPNAGPAAGVRVCDWLISPTIVSNQTVTAHVPALTAGQVLTHCGGSTTYADYEGSYVDLGGGHTIKLRFFGSGSYAWWFDNVAQTGGTLTNTNFTPPWLSFRLSGGDAISTGWPFATFYLTVNGRTVLLARTTSW